MTDVIQLRNTDVVENIRHKHSPLPFGFHSWKEYWSVQSAKEWPENCRIRGCGRVADGSSHVIVNGDEDLVYVIPTCKHHFDPKFSETFSVNSGTLAVYIDEEFIITQRTADLDENFGRLNLEAGMQVRNIQGTHSCHPRGRRRSWKKYWSGKADCEWPGTCRIAYCEESAKGGGHVKVKGKCHGVFILPMCEKHNTANINKLDWLSVKDDTTVVRVGKGDTTGPEGICYCNFSR